MIPIYKALHAAEFAVHSTKKQLYKQSNGDASSHLHRTNRTEDRSNHEKWRSGLVFQGH